GGTAVLLTLADWAAIFIEDHANALKERFVFPRPAAPVIRALANKWQLFELATRHGVPTPRTAYPQSRADVEDFLRTATFPIMVKGADSFLPAPPKEIVRNERDLFAKYDRAAESGSANVILQEYIPGDAESVWMCNAYFGRGSACHAIFTGKKLRQVSDTGVASLADVRAVGRLGARVLLVFVALLATGSALVTLVTPSLLTLLGVTHESAGALG
ncbi:MAG: hypothetical protein ABR591_01990, partial [Candidatus Velthaea sp.]